MNPIDLYYLTGLKLSRGHLIISKSEAILFVDGRYIGVAKGTSGLKVEKLSEENLLKHFTKASFTKLGFDGNALVYQDYLSLKKPLAKIGGKRLKALKSPIKEVRAQKDSREILQIKKSATLLYEGYRYLRRTLKTGMTEKHAALLFEQYVRKNGAESLSFNPIIAFGENAAHPHHIPSSRKLKVNDLVLLDMGVYLEGYASDMTRTFFRGKAPSKLKSLYQVVLSSHAAAVRCCLPGNTLRDLDRAAREVMKKAGVEKLFLHSLGHGIGLEVHELPSFAPDLGDVELKPGMVITIEPGLYLEGVGGIRHEDMIVITQNGAKNLFKGLSL